MHNFLIKLRQYFKLRQEEKTIDNTIAFYTKRQIALAEQRSKLFGELLQEQKEAGEKQKENMARAYRSLIGEEIENA